MELFDQDFAQVVPQKRVAPVDPKTKRFNNLLKKIESLEKKAEETKNHYEEVFTVFKTKLEPLMAEGREIRLGLIKAAYYVIPKLKLSKKQMEDATQMMIDELGGIGFHIELDDDTKRIYESLNKISIDEARKHDNQMGGEMLSEMLKSEGMDIDMNNYDLGKLGRHDPEEVAKFMKDLMEKKIEMEEQNLNKKSQRKEKKKTKKQLEREALQQEKEDFEKRSLKSLYTSLAKILHPDMETDDSLKIEKEEWMKQLTVAYNDQDLATMIKIELHWLQNSKFDPATAPEKQFNTYISFLNERVQELNFEINALAMNPKYMEIIDFIPAGKFTYADSIEDAITGLQTSNSRINELVDLLNSKDVSKNKQKKIDLNDYVAEFWEAKNDMGFNFFDDDDDDDEFDVRDIFKD
ncbi:MAG: hypothetical protein ABI723_20715 [Bacteroidia bacterium]